MHNKIKHRFREKSFIDALTSLSGVYNDERGSHNDVHWSHNDVHASTKLFSLNLFNLVAHFQRLLCRFGEWVLINNQNKLEAKLNNNIRICIMYLQCTFL